MMIKSSPLTEMEIRNVKGFLHEYLLLYDDNIEYTVMIENDNDEIVATGSLRDNVLECICVSERYKNEGLSNKIVTMLTYEAIKRGRSRLFLYTKPVNYEIFMSMGYHEVIRTESVLLMENVCNGVGKYLSGIERYGGEGIIGCVICNCNPLTLGHLYLIKCAAEECKAVYVFVLSEEKSIIDPETRLMLVRESVTGMHNVIVNPGGPYMISSMTFPDYFLSEEQRKNVDDIQCELDLKIFCCRIARDLGINVRYIGTEPYDIITCKYNEYMIEYLNKHGIQVKEFSRMKIGGNAVSASAVRTLIARREYDIAWSMVPEAVSHYFQTDEGREMMESIRKQYSERQNNNE
ncbi:MAG: [citrate (pro-3S)-lyase] ligase [Eubacteriaceae bacterium]|jgi:[citrate (pro-3S)-lyase] ligase|nr:[citrate (pro-3S)-lyase] ligase [Eubacteriaceae bacterium]